MLCVLLALLAACASANHYKTLGVGKSANAEAIKSAYRKLALTHHPDRQRNASPEAKARSQRTFEEVNAAFEVLSDPAQRRQYDFELTHPHRAQSAQHGHPEPPPRPLVEVRVSCSLEQLGGWAEANVPLEAWSAALGAPVSAEVARGLGLPHRIALPPGSRGGDRVRRMLPHIGPVGLDVEFVLVAITHKRWRRNGDALEADLTLPAWRNLPALRRRLRIVGVDGQRVTLLSRGERVGSPRRAPAGSAGRVEMVLLLDGHGMPVKQGDDTEAGEYGSPLTSERGVLRVVLRLRSVRAELALAATRLAAVAALVSAGAAARRRLELLPAALSQLTWRVRAGADALLQVLSIHVMGRARPAARRARSEAARASRLERQRRRAEREAAAARERERRRRRARLERVERAARQINSRLNAWWRWAFDPAYDDGGDAPGAADA